MKALILAAGYATRLRPLTESTPKALLSIGGKPLVEFMIERLRRSGITEITVAVHHKAEMIRERLGDGSQLGVRQEVDTFGKTVCDVTRAENAPAYS